MLMFFFFLKKYRNLEIPLNSHFNSGSRHNLSQPQQQYHQQAQQKPIKVPVVRVDDYSNNQTKSDDEEFMQPIQAISNEPIPLPPPPNCQFNNNNNKQNNNTNYSKDENMTSNSDNKQNANSLNIENNNKSVENIIKTELKLTKDFKPIAKNNEELIHLLDDAERRVAQLR